MRLTFKSYGDMITNYPKITCKKIISRKSTNMYHRGKNHSLSGPSYRDELFSYWYINGRYVSDSRALRKLNDILV
jgi:hypothetical protein